MKFRRGCASGCVAVSFTPFFLAPRISPLRKAIRSQTEILRGSFLSSGWVICVPRFQKKIIWSGVQSCATISPSSLRAVSKLGRATPSARYGCDRMRSKADMDSPLESALNTLARCHLSLGSFMSAVARTPALRECSCLPNCNTARNRSIASFDWACFNKSFIEFSGNLPWRMARF